MSRFTSTALLAVALATQLSASAAVSAFEQYTFEPAANSKVTSISTINLTFANGDYNIEPDRAKTGEITLSDGTHNFYASFVTGFGSIWRITFSDTPNGEAKEITDNGIYTLTIPAGTFYYSTQDQPSDEITAQFTVTDDIDFPVSVFPPDGSRRQIPEFGNIDIYFSFGGAIKLEMTPSVKDATYSVMLDGEELPLSSDLYETDGYMISESGTSLRLQVSKSLVKDKALLTFKADKGAFTVNGIKSPAIDYRIIYSVDEPAPLTGLVPPYINHFDTQADAEGFTIINANNDVDANGNELKWVWTESEWPEGTLVQEMSVWERDGKDDWLITPAMQLEAGKTYRVSLNARPYGFWSEDFEVFAGEANTVEGMTIPVIERVHMRDGAKGAGEYFGYITPEFSGDYYIGVHACLEHEGFRIYIDDLAVSDEMDVSLPEAVADFTITPDNHNIKKAVISFTAPTRTIDGAELGSIDRIELIRDGETIKTFDNPAPGESLAFTDFVEAVDDYIYMVKPFGQAGEGKGLIRTVFIGVKKPSFPTNVHAVETENVGEVLITWDAPATDVDGNPVNTDQLSYYIVKLEGEGESQQQIQIGRYVKETKFVYRAINADADQKMFSFGVFAETPGGFSNGSQTRLIPLGKAYSLPFIESFDTNNISPIAVATLTGAGAWGIFGEAAGGVPAYDTDDCYAGMEGPATDDSAILYTGKVDLSEAVEPKLSFYVYNFGKTSEKYNNTLEVRLTSNSEFKTHKVLDLSTLGDEAGWTLQTIDLSDFKGETPQLGFVATTKTAAFPYTFIDLVKVEDNTSGIGDIDDDNMAVCVDGNTILIANPDGMQITVCDINGRLIISSSATSIREELGQGIYIVRIGTSARKIMVK